MSNGLQKLISKVDNCSTTTCAETLSKLGNVTDIISSTNYDSVASAASLPTASCNTGRFMAITGGTEVCYRYSDGYSWKCDYDSTIGVFSRELWVWGYNNAGQLGISNLTNKSSPVTTCGGGTNWCQISTGGYSSAAIKTDGTLWTWGSGGYGRLGTGTTSSYSSPVTTAGGGTTWCQVSGGMHHIASIKTDGTLWAWGRNHVGQLGTGNLTCYSSPVTTAGGGTTWRQVSGGFFHTASIKTDGTLWTWGQNTSGQLGTGNGNLYSSPVTTAGGGTTWCQVSSGFFHTASIKTDGTLWMWGYNDKGQLGIGDTAHQSSPVTTCGGGTNWCQVSGSACNTLAIKTDGTLWIWGQNSSGQLGTGDLTWYSSPVTTAGGGTTWCQGSAGCNFSSAIKTDGTLWTWGRNNEGELGTGNTTSYSSPVTITGGTNWCQVSGGGYFTAAIKQVTKGF